MVRESSTSQRVSSAVRLYWCQLSDDSFRAIVFYPCNDGECDEAGQGIKFVTLDRWTEVMALDSFVMVMTGF